MRKLGKKRLTLTLGAPLTKIPLALGAHPLTLSANGQELIYTYGENCADAGVAALLADLVAAGAAVTDLRTDESSLEDIFVSLIRRAP
jgi:ABC-2 type transport system ATP-binding protein